MKEFWNKNKKNLWFWLFLGIALATLVALPVMSLDAGNSGDEDGFQIIQGRYVVDWYQTHGKDTMGITFMREYSSSPDVITEIINRSFDVDDIHITRHIVFSLMGWLSILAVGLIGCLVGGFQAGVFSMLLLFFSPAFVGQCFNNPKDIPLASAVVMALYGILLFFKQFPNVKWYTFVITILSIAFAVSVRVGGLILVGYFGVFGLVYLMKILIERIIANRRQVTSDKLSGKKPAKKVYNKKKYDLSFGKLFGRMLWMGALICVLGYFLGILLWPYALTGPIKNVISAYNAMAHFEQLIRQLFEGTFIYSDARKGGLTPELRPLFSLIFLVILILLVVMNVRAAKQQKS